MRRRGWVVRKLGGCREVGEFCANHRWATPRRYDRQGLLLCWLQCRNQCKKVDQIGTFQLLQLNGENALVKHFSKLHVLDIKFKLTNRIVLHNFSSSEHEEGDKVASVVLER